MQVQNGWMLTETINSIIIDYLQRALTILISSMHPNYWDLQVQISDVWILCTN